MIMDQEPSAQQPAGALPPALWEFVRLADYRLPNSVGASAALEKWTSFKRLFRYGDEEEQAPVKAEAELRMLSDSRLQALVQPIDWHCAAAALDLALADWLHTSKPDRPVRFVVGQPHCGHPEILAHWAARHRLHRVAAPSVEQILGGDERWREDWPSGDRPWVLPNLEHCYLRHADGLGLVRRLLAQAVSGALGRGVIGCDSWAWVYLQEVWPLPQPDALTLQAFDGARLSRYLGNRVSREKGGCLRFCNAVTGKEIQLACGPDDSKVSPEVNQLAVHSRGNIGVAWTAWRALLRSLPEQERPAEPKPESKKHEQSDEAERAAQGAQADDDFAAETVWVSASLQEPPLPAEKGEGMAFILHALLLHNGLPVSVLPELLPQPEHRIASHLLQLQALGVVDLAGGRWQISASAYSVVREFLRRRGFLRDEF
ncbi:MAG: hypothetical protein AW10_03155 [Candidatus Accumulibacter appositus]|uniref:Uncharacterized protein n=1 Tax=Candidatus Accumulibacter appositus TaxID=1454003 RepID=A0A011NSH9_9PROT|nr:hypothetical protein [Accumulibacter sp.]EXI78311.1 MAG: hypothetical protein AW10_03155 [Candidatus Accumulibacter appositus]HRF04071.1 hypothetical protein [Accumulibacter sp.]